MMSPGEVHELRHALSRPMSPGEVYELRQALSMTGAEFAALLAVDLRTVRRWESGAARPTASAEAVLGALAYVRDELDVDTEWPELVDKLRGWAWLGGLRFVVVKLLQRVLLLEQGGNRHPGGPDTGPGSDGGGR